METEILQHTATGFSKKNCVAPKVSIGMPVFNGEKTVKDAINSIINQTYSNFELILSDNASTDLTEKICRVFAEKDQRIIYHRQSANLGAASNFRFVLELAQGEFFAWAACDDTHSDNFIEDNLKFLEQHPEFVASTSPIQFQDSDFDEYRMGDKSLIGDVPERIIGFFQGWHANGRFYSLMRRESLIGCTEIGKFYLGSDWAVIIHLLSIGKMNRLENGWLSLGKNGISNSKNIFKLSRTLLIEHFFPFFKLSIYTQRATKNILSQNEKLRIYGILLKLNLRAFYYSNKFRIAYTK